MRSVLSGCESKSHSSLTRKTHTSLLWTVVVIAVYEDNDNTVYEEDVMNKPSTNDPPTMAQAKGELRPMRATSAYLYLCCGDLR